MAEISQNVNIEMLEKLPDGTYKRKYPKTKASQVKLEDTTGNFTATEVEGAMQELFTNVSNGKDLVGGAITGVDDSVVIPTDPTFGDLASAIGGISTGKKWASGVATVDRNGKTSITGLPFTPTLIVGNLASGEAGNGIPYFSFTVTSCPTNSLYPGVGDALYWAIRTSSKKDSDLTEEYTILTPDGLNGFVCTSGYRDSLDGRMIKWTAYE